MEIVYSDEDLSRYIRNAVEVDPEKPVLVDKVSFFSFFFFAKSGILIFADQGKTKKKKLTTFFCFRFHSSTHSTSTAPTRSTSTPSATRTVTQRSAASCSTSSR